MGSEFRNFHINILLSFCVLHLSSCASPSKKSSVENKNYPVRVEESSARNEKVFKPEVSSTIDLVVDHKFFKIVYDPDTRLAKYVSYDLKSSYLKMKSYKRKDRFREDPILVKKGIPTSKPSEYTKSGYDKGHLAPSADFSWNEEANDLTFVMSNMVPQKASLNRDAWRRLEAKVRLWACGEGHISVITGPIELVQLPRLKSGLAIPEQFFKIVIDQTPPRKYLAFIYQQNDKGDVLSKRSVPLVRVEKATQLSFTKFFNNFNSDEKRSPASLSAWVEAKCD